MDIISQQLRSAGLRVTAPRQLIFGLLSRSKRPLSIETAWSKTKRQGVDRVTVYRTMEVLAAAGLARRVDLGHAHDHFEMNDPNWHHHHLVCQSCGDIQDVQIAGEEQTIKKLERRHKFQTTSHSFEIFGLCAGCQ